MAIRTLLFSTLVAACPLVSAAQEARLQVLAGAALNGAYAPDSKAEYRTITLPAISAGLHIQLTPAVAIWTGAGVQQKGYVSHNFIDGEPGDYTIIEVRFRCTQLNIPLQISIDLMPRRSWGLQLGGGMSYGFMLRAEGVSDWTSYRRDIRVHTDRTEFRPKIALLPYDNRLALPNQSPYGAMLLFNPAFTGSLTLRARQHYLVQIFGEYNLYNASGTGTAKMHFYSAGLCLGYRLK